MNLQGYQIIPTDDLEERGVGGTSLAVRWLRFQAPNAGDIGLTWHAAWPCQKKRGVGHATKKWRYVLFWQGSVFFFSGMQHFLRDPSSPSRDWTQGTAVKARIFTTRNSLGGSFKAEPQDCLRHFLLRGKRQGLMFCPPLKLGSVTAWPTEHGRSDTASLQA